MAKLKNINLLGQRAASRAQAQILGRRTRAVLLTTANGSLLVDPRDQVVGRRLRRHGVYAAHELTRLKALLKSQDKVLLVGAHVGAIAIPLSFHCRELHALEPNPHSRELLESNVALNKRANITVHQYAAAERNGTIEFLTSTANSGGSKRKPLISKFTYTFDNPELVKVQARRLDDEFRAGEIDVVIMDIEGSEFFALQGMQALLARVRILVMEFVPHHLDNVANVSLDRMLEYIVPHFEAISVPSQAAQPIPIEDGVALLRSMAQRGLSDDGIIFYRASPTDPFLDRLPAEAEIQC